MENKSKFLIVTLSVVLFVVLFWCILNKPKKYKKQQKAICNSVPETPADETTETTVETVVADPVIETITASDCAAHLYASMLGHGTDTRALLEYFDMIDTDEEFDDVMESFQEQTGSDFDDVLSKEMFTAKIVANKINDLLVSKGIDRMITIEK